MFAGRSPFQPAVAANYQSGADYTLYPDFLVVPESICICLNIRAKHNNLVIVFSISSIQRQYMFVVSTALSSWPDHAPDVTSLYFRKYDPSKSTGMNFL